MDQFIARLDIRIVALTLAVAIFIAWEVGKWMGYRLLSKGHPKPSKFDDASMAVMGLLLAFAFGTSITKYDQRRIAVVAESFFASLKTELVYQTRWSTRAEARSAVFDYIERFYNRQRRHSALGYLCPNEFELRHHQPMAA